MDGTGLAGPNLMLALAASLIAGVLAAGGRRGAQGAAGLKADQASGRFQRPLVADEIIAAGQTPRDGGARINHPPERRDRSRLGPLRQIGQRRFGHHAQIDGGGHRTGGLRLVAAGQLIAQAWDGAGLARRDRGDITGDDLRRGDEHHRTRFHPAKVGMQGDGLRRLGRAQALAPVGGFAGFRGHRVFQGGRAAQQGQGASLAEPLTGRNKPL